MKKKLMFYLCISILVNLFIITVLFISIANFQYQNSVLKQLKNTNNVVKNMIDSDNLINVRKFFENNCKNGNVRFTYLNKNGDEIYDSKLLNKNLKKHIDTKEIKEALKNGQGTDTRVSKTTKQKTIYFATKLKNGSYIRSSIEISSIVNFNTTYLESYFIVILFVFIVTIIFSNRISYIIIKPIKDLDFITSKIAEGELDRRVAIVSNDEIGQLGKSFNKMACKLQENINDSLEKQKRLEAILKSMDSGIIAIDRNYNIIMINPYAKNLFNISVDVIGKNLLEVIKNRDIEKAFRDNSYDYYEMRLFSPNEKILRIKTADIVNRNEHIGRVGVLQDITDIKKLENMRSEFVANVSHELKTPLTSIKGFAETLKEVDDYETRQKFLNIINDEAERLTRLISDILVLSDIEQRKEVKIEKLDINNSIKQICSLMKNVAYSKNITIYEEYSDLPKIDFNTDRFKQMIINLVDNAIKYTEDGGKVFVKTENFGKHIKIYIKDNGVGIPKECTKRIFERFYRVDKARSRKKGGTGLGLAIVKHIVFNMNGTIEVESVVGKGSKFIITLPIL